MKRPFLPLFWFSTLIALILMVSCNDREIKAASKNEATKVYHRNVSSDSIYNINKERESITFILGEDKNTDNPYYTEATKFYQNNPEGKTTYLETHCRSLTEIRNYLVKYAPVNKLPWGRINLVSHGDQWLGLSVKVTASSKRSTTERIQEYIDKDSFPALPVNIIDQQTNIIICACGVGNNPELIEVIAKVFSTTQDAPKIYAPRLFEFYSSETNNNGQIENLQYMTQAWMIAYQKDENPGRIKICNMLHEKYPDIDIDWQNAINRKHPRFGGDTYHYSFIVPIIMTINLGKTDSIPNLNDTIAKLNWVKQQPAIANAIAKIQIPYENFSWNLKKGYTSSKSGKKISIQVKGYCTMLCILKPLADANISSKGNIKPLVPDMSDTTYYYILNGRPILSNEIAQN